MITDKPENDYTSLKKITIAKNIITYHLFQIPIPATKYVYMYVHV